MSFQASLKRSATDIRAFLDQEIANRAVAPMQEPMRYAVSGGKGLRGFLVLESAKLHNGSPKAAQFAAAAIESMHAYSLVHDDLPCMDDDDLRRGLPTVHKKWNEATAVLVGDALQSLAFELLAEPDIAQHSAALVHGLAKSAGAGGMVLGQAQDIAAETSAPLSLDQIIELQRNKTGALIEWSCLAGAIIGDKDTTAMRGYAQCLGLAFQIADDILDVEGDISETGKAVGKDADAGKATFVSHMGLDGAKRRAREQVSEALEHLSIYGSAADNLREAAEFVISRRS